MKILVFKIFGDDGQPNYFICFVYEDGSRENDAIWVNSIFGCAIGITDVTSYDGEIIRKSIEFHNMDQEEIDRLMQKITNMCH